MDPTEPEIVSRHDFKQCPHCEETETVTINNWKLCHDGKMPEQGFVGATTRIIKLAAEEPAPGDIVHVEVCYMDICAGCGLERCIRVEVQKVEVPPQVPGLSLPFQMPRRGMPPGFGRG
jgi:hypothetical protein